MSDVFLLYPLKAGEFAGSADLIPALVLQPAGIRVRNGVLQTHSPRQQEQEVRVHYLPLRPAITQKRQTFIHGFDDKS